MAWYKIYKVAALILLSAHSKGDLPEDDFRIINRQGESHYLHLVSELHLINGLLLCAPKNLILYL